MKLPKYLYHGTSLHRWKQVAAGGFVTDQLYLTRTPTGTEQYSRWAVEHDETRDGVDPEENPYVRVKFSLEKLDPTGLEPDWDDVQTNMELFPEATDSSDVSWYESLAKLGTCSYVGPLQQAIVKVDVIE